MANYIHPRYLNSDEWKSLGFSMDVKWVYRLEDHALLVNMDHVSMKHLVEQPRNRQEVTY